jgi:4-alpha-glucanotransferase
MDDGTRLLGRNRPPALNARAAGILLHPTSLPGPLGAGDVGPVAYAFLEALARAGMRWWQMLPITPPGPAPEYSPYSSHSAFAGSPWLISPELLSRQGLLSKREIVRSTKPPGARIDFPEFQATRLRLLRQAFDRRGQLTPPDRENFEQFVASNAGWLEDYALYAAIHDWRKTAWNRWPIPLRLRKREALAEARQKLAEEIHFQKYLQWIFHAQWTALKQYANERGIGLIGDIPIFVSHDSADVWANSRLFLLEPDGSPSVVSGYPPDPFAPKGQRWGHPHYRWPEHRKEHFAWWLARFETTLKHFDAVRIDHFLGFHRVWAVPARAKDAIGGKWLTTPGDAIFSALVHRLGKAPIIAEDLGSPTKQATALRDKFKFPGMRIVQFGFGKNNYHSPSKFPRNSVVYTGTHDNETLAGWFEKVKTSSNGELTRIVQQIGRLSRQPHWDFIRAVFASRAQTAIVPVQDVLGSGMEHRMNIPGVLQGNWGWRMAGPLTGTVISRLRALAEETHRI